MSKIIDVHIHDPYIYEIDKRNPRSVADELLKLMDKYNIEYVFIYALEADPLKPSKELSKKKVYKGVEDAVGRGLYALPRLIINSLQDYEKTIHDHISTLKTIYTPTERVAKISRYSHGRIFPVGNMRLAKNIEENIDRLNQLIKLKIKGFKLYPTIQFLQPESRALLPLYDVLVKNEIPLFMHTGCDPGLWELPRFCESSDPIKIVDVAERYPDLKIILCHTGAYSALKPGIFLENAIKVINRYDNVYGDLSAVEPEIIEYIVEKTDYTKLMFGSDYPVTGREWGALINNVKLLDIPDEMKEHILYYNARNILRI